MGKKPMVPHPDAEAAGDPPQQDCEQERPPTEYEQNEFDFWLLTGVPVETLRLHYESVSYAGQDAFWALIQAGNPAKAAAMMPFWRVATLEIAGPLVSLTTVLVAAHYVRRCWLAAVIGTVGIFRFLAPAVFVLVNSRLTHQGLLPVPHWG
jgi:hypothetical protein